MYFSFFYFLFTFLHNFLFLLFLVFSFFFLVYPPLISCTFLSFYFSPLSLSFMFFNLLLLFFLPFICPFPFHFPLFVFTDCSILVLVMKLASLLGSVPLSSKRMKFLNKLNLLWPVLQMVDIQFFLLFPW